MISDEDPKIYVISRPRLDFEQIQNFLDDRNLEWIRSPDATDGEEIVEICGRICYLSFSGDARSVRFPISKYISNLIDGGHESVLEHASWTFIFDNISRSFTHQLVRHRIGFSYSQLSQQYHDESDADYIIPADINADEEMASVWHQAIENSAESYRRILTALDNRKPRLGKEVRRRIRSAARSLLPNATSTTIAVSANARSIRHFLKLRGSIVGDIEMRKMAHNLLEAVKVDAPTLFADFYSIIHDEDGLPIVYQSDKAIRQPEI